MQLNSVRSLSRLSSNFLHVSVLNSTGITTTRFYAKAPAIPTLGKKGKLAKSAGPTLEKKILPVETDPNRLVSYVCGSCINKEGEDIKLKDDSEYPDWLWTLPTGLGKVEPLENLDPDTWYYWYRHRKEAMKRINRLQKLKKF